MNILNRISKSVLHAIVATAVATIAMTTMPAHAESSTAAQICRDHNGASALEACEQLKEAGLDTPWIYLRYGQLLTELNQKNLALEIYREGLQKHPADNGLIIQHRIASSLVEEGNLQHTGAQTRGVLDEVTRLKCDKLKRLNMALPPECSGGVKTWNEPANTTAKSAEAIVVARTPARTTVPSTSRNDASYSDLQRQLDELKQILAKQSQQKAKQAETTPANTKRAPLKDIGPRHALVIGNADYMRDSQRLESPVNDAKDVAKALRGLDFKVTLATDLENQYAFESALLNFQKKLSRNPDSVGLVFYAGHAMQFDGQNYLIPTQTDIRGPQDVRAKTLSLDYINETLDYADNQLNIVVLDACRDNPFRSFTRSNAEGLASTRPATDGYLVIYAAKPGYRAIDSVGRNSPFTKHFIREISESGQPIELMFKNLARAVDEETGGEQTPWLEGQFFGNFVFNLEQP